MSTTSTTTTPANPSVFSVASAVDTVTDAVSDIKTEKSDNVSGNASANTSANASPVEVSTTATPTPANTKSKTKKKKDTVAAAVVVAAPAAPAAADAATPTSTPPTPTLTPPTSAPATPATPPLIPVNHQRIELYPDEIDADPESNVCRPFGFTEDSVMGLAASMSDPTTGQLQNITVGPKDKSTGLYPLITGFRRQAAGAHLLQQQLAAGIPREKCIKLEVNVDLNYTALRALDANIAENMQRKSLSVVETSNAMWEYKKAHNLDDSVKSMEQIGTFCDMDRASVIQYLKVYTTFSNKEKKKLHEDAVRLDPLLMLAKMSQAERDKLISQLDTDSYAAELEAVTKEEDAEKALAAAKKAQEEEARLLEEQRRQEEEEAAAAAAEGEDEEEEGSKSKSKSKGAVKTSAAVKSKKSKEEREAVRKAAKAHTAKLLAEAKKKEEEAKAARTALKGKNAPGKITAPNITAAAKTLGIECPGKALNMAQFKKQNENMLAVAEEDNTKFPLTRKQVNFITRLLECCDGVRSEKEYYGFIRQYVDTPE